VAGDVDDFADEEEAGNIAGFHGFAGKLAGVHAAGSDFSLLVALSGGGTDGPGVQLLLESTEAMVGESARGVKFEPTRGKAIGEKFLEDLAGGR
jgi:hypothetical protein